MLFSSCLNLDKVDIEHVLMPSIYYVFYYLFGINYLQSTIYYTDKSRAIHTTRRAVTMVETTVVCDPVLHRSSLQTVGCDTGETNIVIERILSG